MNAYRVPQKLALGPPDSWDVWFYSFDSGWKILVSLRYRWFARLISWSLNSLSSKAARNGVSRSATSDWSTQGHRVEATGHGKWRSWRPDTFVKHSSCRRAVERWLRPCDSCDLPDTGGPTIVLR